MIFKQKFITPVLFKYPSDLFLMNQRLSNQKLIVESTTVSASTLTNIEKAITTGTLLVIENPDEELIKVCQPLLSWILRRVNRSIYFNLGSFAAESSKSVPSNTESTKVFLDFNGKVLKMHDAFRFCFVVQDNSFALNNDFLNKVKSEIHCYIRYEMLIYQINKKVLIIFS